MRIESIKSVYEVYPNQMVNRQYTMYIDPATNKQIVTVVTHTIELYDSKGMAKEWSDKQAIDRMA
jgi:hypothetical protein